MSREDFDGIRKHAKQNHDLRVAKTPERIIFAKNQFKKHDIKHVLKNAQTGHFHAWRKRDDKLFQFYAGTGKIQGVENARGIHALIKILCKGD
jgi:hypothetical protein